MIKKISYSQDDLMEDLLLKNQTEADGKSIPGTINEIIDNMNANPSPVKSVANGNGMILDSSGKLMMNKSSTLTAGAMSKEDKIKLDGLHNYELPTASTDTLGGVKVDGTSITINQNGVISSINQGKVYQNITELQNEIENLKNEIENLKKID